MLAFEYLIAKVVSRARTDRGGNLIEYALLVSLIAVVCILAVTFMGKSVSSKFSGIASAII